MRKFCKKRVQNVQKYSKIFKNIQKFGRNNQKHLTFEQLFYTPLRELFEMNNSQF
jgi:hypothetical protein